MNNQTPFFSIVLPTYNRAHLIEPAIQSIINQTFTNWQLVVVDDGSTDNTKQVVAGFNDARIKYIYQQNKERSAARNTGMENAAGMFICFIDSDDLWYKNHLQLIHKSIIDNNQKAALYFTGMRWNFGTHTRDILFDSPKGKNPVQYVITNQIAPSTVCLHRVITEIIKFNTTLRINEDVEFFARIAARYELIQIPEITIDLNVHEGNTRGQTKDYVKPQIDAMEIIFNHSELKDSVPAAFKKSIFKNLQHQHINHYYNTGEYSKMNREISRFLFLYPLDAGNKTKFVLLLYNLPGGSILKWLIGKFKRNK